MEAEYENHGGPVNSFIIVLPEISATTAADELEVRELLGSITYALQTRHAWMKPGCEGM